MDTPVTRALSVAALGLALVWLTLQLMDVQIDREDIGLFVVIPIGGLLVASSIVFLAWFFYRD